MGATHHINPTSVTQPNQQTTSQILKYNSSKPKKQIQFRQNDFIRQIQGSISDQYEILSPYLCQNQFYQLRKVIHKKTKLIRSVYIVNKYKIRSSEREFLSEQINKLKVIDHPNINKIYELFKDSHRFYIVMELCQGQSLSQILQRQLKLEEKRVAQIMHQMFNVLGHCHRKGVIHSDLKLENIIFNSKKQDIIKVVDFSISRIFRIDDIVEQSRDKAFLCSPESFNNQSSSKSDIWQCGILMYMLLSGQIPFVGSKKSKLARKLLYYIPNFSQKGFQKISKEAKQLIKSMLKINPNDRPTAQQCLQSMWLKKYYKEPKISNINLKRCLLQCYHFNASSKLQEATWTFFVNALVPFCQKQNILNVFNKIDTKGKGQLGYEQIYHGFTQLYSNNSQKCHQLTQTLFSRLKKSKITFSHFLTISTNRLFLINPSNIQKIFVIFDSDSSGQISVLQLKQVLGSSKQLNEQIWLQLMKEADSNSDGMISFQEFSQMMRMLARRENEEELENNIIKENCNEQYTIQFDMVK